MKSLISTQIWFFVMMVILAFLIVHFPKPLGVRDTFNTETYVAESSE